MGADGGICWMKLKDPSKYNRVIELLRSFYFFTSMNMNADWQQDACEQFLDENSDLGCPDYLVGTYGSFQDFSIYDTLENILHNSDEDICFNSSWTFLELAEEFGSRPLMDRKGGFFPSDRGCSSRSYCCYDYNMVSPTILEWVVWDIVNYCYPDLDKIEERLQPIGKMIISEWLKELQSMLHERAGFEETWT